MCAREEQLEPLVGDRVDPLQECRDIETADDPVSLLERCRGAARGGSQNVAQAVPGHGEQPPFRILRNARRRPGLQSALECVCQRVLRESEVAGRRREQRDQPTVRRPRREVGGLAGGGRVHQWWA
jgi:hypothetical protein